MENRNAGDLTENCSVISSSASPHKKRNVEIDELEDKFSSPTPVKTIEPSHVQEKIELLELPEKYGILLEFFERMISSLRLLGLRKKTPNFQNVSTQVEILTGRKFVFSHLAQIKYILPEAVQIEKILIHDEKTKCMKPDVKIELLFDVVKDHHEESVFVALGKVFSSRIREFVFTHPEACDVPEASLPEPYSQRSVSIKEDSFSKHSPTLSEREGLNPSHLPPTFKKSFYQISATAEIEDTTLLSPVKSDHKIIKVVETATSTPMSPVTERYSVLGGTPAHSDHKVNKVVETATSTPMRPVTERYSVLVGTPAQSTPMRPISPTRSVLTCEDETKTSTSQKGKQSTISAKKSLDFYSVDGEGSIFSGKQTSVCPSNLVLLIHQIFQSVKFGPITKDELVHKIITNSFEFDNRYEVETQMENLEKLVPDWFCKKTAPSGDLLYNVNKVSDLNSVRERINAI